MAIRSYLPIGSVRRNAEVGIDVPHALFHADGFVPIITSPVFLPARIVAIKAALIVGSQTPLPAISPTPPLVVVAVPLSPCVRRHPPAGPAGPHTVVRIRILPASSPAGTLL